MGEWAWKHRAVTSTCVCWHQQGFSCWLREQIFWKCHVCVYFAALCEMERVPVRAAQQPSASWPQPHATSNGELAYGLARWNTGWVGKLGSFWPDEPDHLDAFQQGISASCCSVPRWVPGAMFQFITQSLTWVRCLQWTNASQAHPCLIYVNAGLGETNEGRQCYSTIMFSFGGSSLLYSPTFFCHCHFIVYFGGACFPNLCPIPENGTDLLLLGWFQNWT